MATILTIDWDYFAHATADERAGLFPDGGNELISAGLQNYIWITRYADALINSEMRGGKALTDIEADRGEIENLYYTATEIRLQIDKRSKKGYNREKRKGKTENAWIKSRKNRNMRS